MGKVHRHAVVLEPGISLHQNDVKVNRGSLIPAPSPPRTAVSFS